MKQKDIRDDIKMILAFVDTDGVVRNPAITPFEISLFNMDKKTNTKRLWKATYDGTTYNGCKVVIYDGANTKWIGKPVVLVMYDYDREKHGDKGFFNVGALSVTAYISYPDDDMQGGSYDKMYRVEQEEGIEIINLDR